MNRTFVVIGALSLMLAVGACSHGNPAGPKYFTPGSASASQPSQAASTSATATSGTVQAAGSVKGAGGQIPAFYDGERFTINDVEVSDVASDHIGSNPTHNAIFVTNDLDDPQDFDPVLDAIQGDGFNPLWEQILIVFKPGVTPHQFVSDDEVLDAAAGAGAEITLVDTGEVYRCSVVGKK